MRALKGYNAARMAGISIDAPAQAYVFPATVFDSKCKCKW